MIVLYILEHRRGDCSSVSEGEGSRQEERKLPSKRREPCVSNLWGSELDILNIVQR